MDPTQSRLATARIGCVGVPRLGATLQRGSLAWPGYTPASVCEGGPVGVPARRGQEEVSYTIHESILQSSTARLLVTGALPQVFPSHKAWVICLNRESESQTCVYGAPDDDAAP
jgi:hypothetical protein